MVNQKKKTYRTIILLGKLVIIVGICVFIVLKLKDEQNINEVFITSITEATRKHWAPFIIVILLMPVNWLLEAKKWMLLSEPVKIISVKEALSGVLAGLSIGFITPHGVGAYIGRILMFKGADRGKLVGGVLLGRLFQLAATMLFGGIGVFYLLGKTFFLTYCLLLLCIFVPFVLLLSYSFDLKYVWLKRISFYISIVKSYSLKHLLLIFFIAVLRYMVFSFQFILVLSMFTNISWLLKTAGTTWILMAKSVIPTFNFLSDLGVREFSAIYFFEQFDTPIIPVLSASLLVWTVNILIPTIVGIPLVWKLKFSV